MKMKKVIKIAIGVVIIAGVLFVTALHMFPAFEMAMHELTGWH